MDSDAASRRTLLGVAGVASLCCVGSGAAAVTGGTTVGLVAGLVQGLVVFVVLGAGALLFRRRSDCSSCDT
ncbi:hypothetical protein [Halopiger xanaduensis]|uniref:Uncharacterized protein n=1 Tax=Halopiger xanaduensis (strain DSM 18323 / JCM 14033 / SH-6) TaxID=797210 RepID=F8DEB8_HALXS|nr:hypothetical protein [Halopiger xanaduensis]AEH39400.1 hypothetical protein Halxa_0157 [Halopiger xanaduensis SH-6]